jgi:hypothetical protein
MRILLDESVPVQVRNALRDHEVTTAQRMGSGGFSNGRLLDAAEAAGFELLIVAAPRAAGELRAANLGLHSLRSLRPRL